MHPCVEWPVAASVASARPTASALRPLAWPSPPATPRPALGSTAARARRRKVRSGLVLDTARRDLWAAGDRVGLRIDTSHLVTVPAEPARSAA